MKIRGTTSGLMLPHSSILLVSSNTIRCIGRTRPSLLKLQEGRSGRYFNEFPLLPCTYRQFSVRKESLTSSHQCVCLKLSNILANCSTFVKGKPEQTLRKQPAYPRKIADRNRASTAKIPTCVLCANTANFGRPPLL